MSSYFNQINARQRRTLRLFVTLMRASDSLLQRSFQDDPLGKQLTQTEFAILEALLFGGSMHQCDVANRILKSRGNISLTVQRLVEKSLVRRDQDPEDRRHTWISLSDEGRKLIESVFPGVAEGIEKACDQLSDTELEEYIRLNKKLGLGGTSDHET